MFAMVLTSSKRGDIIENEQMFDRRAWLKERYCMPQINLLWWLTLILLAVVAGYLLAAAKNAEEAAGRRLAAASAAGFAQRRPSLPDSQFQAGPEQAHLPHPAAAPRRTAAFFPIGTGPEADGEKSQQHEAYSYELPRLADCEMKMAAVSDCHHCA
jgi:hypothetical protein